MEACLLLISSFSSSFLWVPQLPVGLPCYVVCLNVQSSVGGRQAEVVVPIRVLPLTLIETEEPVIRGLFSFAFDAVAAAAAAAAVVAAV